MQINSNRVEFLVGNEVILNEMDMHQRCAPFSEEVLDFLSALSAELRKNSRAKKISDILTFAFWCRKASIENMRKPYTDIEDRLGRGMVFHIAPSNIPMMFAFSLGVSLLAGNSNIIRVSQKEFEQAEIVCDVMNELLRDKYMHMQSYICIIRYPHDVDITKDLSSFCSTRIIWGGNQTIHKIRQLALSPRATELTFYDRYSICMIQADQYLEAADKDKLTEGFYNDTYFTDQNACTSPQLIVWFGDKVEQAKQEFWKRLHDYTSQNYKLQPIQGVDKLTELDRIAIIHPEVKFQYKDMLLCRIEVPCLYADMMEHRCPGGFFFEYTAKSMEELAQVCKVECQTISYYGFEKEEIKQTVIRQHFAGVDRIVAIGHTMDFTLVWDGFDFIYSLSKKIGS